MAADRMGSNGDAMRPFTEPTTAITLCGDMTLRGGGSAVEEVKMTMGRAASSSGATRVGDAAPQSTTCRGSDATTLAVLLPIN